MAKINVEFDTVEKTMTVTVDGQNVPNVCEVDFCRGFDADGDDDDSYSCVLTTMVQDDDQKVTHMTRMVAADSAEGKALFASASQPAKLKGFLTVGVKPQVHADIEKYFGVE